METEAAQMIGAGLAAIGLGGVGVGIGNVFATTIATIGRIRRFSRGSRR